MMRLAMLGVALILLSACVATAASGPEAACKHFRENALSAIQPFLDGEVGRVETAVRMEQATSTFIDQLDPGPSDLREEAELLLRLTHSAQKMGEDGVVAESYEKMMGGQAVGISDACKAAGF